MKKYIVDRIEGEYAVLESEDGDCIDVAASLIPNVHEGDSVQLENGIYTVNHEETQMRRKRIEEKMRRLFRRDE